MATLSLTEIEGSTPTLREWLGGDWGLLFSHPSDFQDHSLENDRWLEALREEFRARRLRSLVRSPDGHGAECDWVSELIRDYRLRCRTT